MYLSGIDEGLETIGETEFVDTILKPILGDDRDQKNWCGKRTILPTLPASQRWLISPKLKNALWRLPEQSGEPLPADVARKVFRTRASVNAMTYFANQVIKADPTFISLDANWYYRNQTDRLLTQPFVGDVQSQFESAIADLEDNKTDAALTAPCCNLSADHP